MLQSLYGNANKGEHDLWESEQNKKERLKAIGALLSATVTILWIAFLDGRFYITQSLRKWWRWQQDGV